MRFSELFEDNEILFDLNGHSDAELKSFIRYIQKNCHLWIDAVDDPISNVIYRGTHSAPHAAAYKLEVRKDRLPLGSSELEHDIFNKIIKAHGLSSNRSNSLFVSGNINQASTYGVPWIVFPIGNFNYTWSPQVHDWYKTPTLLSPLSDPEIYFKDFHPDPNDILDGLVKGFEKLIERYERAIEYQQQQLDSDKEIFDLAKNNHDYPNRSYALNIAKANIENWELALEKSKNEIKNAEKALQLYKKYGLKAHDNVKELYSSFSRNMAEVIYADVMEYLLSSANISDLTLDIKKWKDKNNVEIKGDDGSLIKAIKAGHEIMIHTDYVVMIKEDFFEELKPMLRK